MWHFFNFLYLTCRSHSEVMCVTNGDYISIPEHCDKYFHDYELIKSSSVICSSHVRLSHSLVVVIWLKFKPLNRLLIASTRRSCANALALILFMMYELYGYKLEHKGESNPKRTLCAYACMLSQYP